MPAEFSYFANTPCLRKLFLKFREYSARKGCDVGAMPFREGMMKFFQYVDLPYNPPPFGGNGSTFSQEFARLEKIAIKRKLNHGN